MPTYDYACPGPKCKKVKEVMHGMNDKPKVKCKCGKVMKKQIGMGANIVFKGEGFYCNDYPK